MVRANKSSSASASSSWRLQLGVSVGLLAFLVLFRPFGLTITKLADVLVLVGVIPVNFCAMAIVHDLILPRLQTARVITAFVASGVIGLFNIIYLAPFSAAPGALVVKVMLVAGLALLAIWSWRRQQALNHEVIDLRERAKNVAHDQRHVVLKGDSETEIIKLDASALCYVQAEGNYVRVVWRNDGVKEKLLRATLQSTQDAADGLLMRCHRSFLVNLDAAERVEGPLRSMRVVFTEADSVPVARGYAEEIRKAAKAL